MISFASVTKEPTKLKAPSTISTATKAMHHHKKKFNSKLKT